MERRHRDRGQPIPRGRASSLEILGDQANGRKVPAKWATHNAELIRLRDELRGQRRRLKASAAAEPAISGEHMADHATDSYDRDWALALASSDQTLLFEVYQALKRITDGTYGVCELTGKPIEPDRLKALPWARFSAAAQAELERRGVTPRTRLGKLGSYASMPSDGASEEEFSEEPPEERQAA